MCPLVHDDMATAAGSGVAPRAAAPPLIPVATQRRRAKWPPPIPFLEQGRPAQRRRPSSKGPRTRPRSRPQRQSDPRSRPEPLDASRDSAGACATDPSTSLATRVERNATNTATCAGCRPKVEVVSGAPRADLMGRPRRCRHRPYGGRDLITCNWPGSSDQRTGGRNSLDRIRSCSGIPPSAWRLSARRPRTARVRPDGNPGKLLEHLFDFSAKLA